ADRLADERQQTEAFNNRQRLIDSRSESFWSEAMTSLDSAIKKINKTSEVVSFETKDEPGGGMSVTATINYAKPKHLNLAWNRKHRTVSIISSQAKSCGYEFGVENDSVVL